MAFPDRLRFFHDFLVLARGFVLVRRVLLVFALAMLLSGAFGHLALPFIM
jgi:hypothetical protein